MATSEFKLRKLLTLQGWKEMFATEKDEKEAYFRPNGAGVRTYYTWSMYDGERNLGGIGPVKDYWLDYESLRARGWQAYLTNESVQTIVNKLIVWTIGRGLKPDYNPNVVVLKSEGIQITPEQVQGISELIEARFCLYKESKYSSYSGMMNLSHAESVCYRNSKNGGDTLVVLRYINNMVKFELIDGCHVISPMGGDDWNPRELGNGNRIMNGVEMNDRGEHVAYHIRDAKLKYHRIEAKSKTTGLTVAFLVGGLEYRLDNSRCIPALSGLFEVLATMDRYKSATIATAEEQAKIVYQIKHGATSTGENPLIQQITQARDTAKNDGTVPVSADITAMADKVAVSTEKQVINNVPDSEVMPINKNQNELYFKDFYSTFFDLVCAAIGMPPNVAMSKYDTSFSSARAAIKDWEHSLLIDRYKFSLAFLQPIFELWLHTEVLKNKIELSGYLLASAQKNETILACYRQVTWIGDNVPHIDPLKEVMAERLKLGNTSDSIPLTTVEAATQTLNGGDSRSNLQQYSKELEQSKKVGVKVEEPKMKVAPKGASYSELFAYAFGLEDN